MKPTSPLSIFVLALMAVLSCPSLVWAGSNPSDGSVEVPFGYRGLARAGYPMESIFAISRMEAFLGKTEMELDRLTDAEKRLDAFNYSEPVFTWWPWEPPHGHPAGSLWLLSKFIREDKKILVARMDSLNKAVAFSKQSLGNINDSYNYVGQIVEAEADIQGQAYRDELSIKRKYGKLAKEIGAEAPWEMLKPGAIRNAMGHWRR